MSASDTPRSGRPPAGGTGPGGRGAAARSASGTPPRSAPSGAQSRTGPPTAILGEGVVGPAGPSGSPAAAAPAAAPAAGARAAGRTRKARLVLARVDPWSVMKLSFLLSIALAIVMVTAVFVLWTVLDRIAVFSSLAGTIQDVTASESNAGFDLMDYVGLSRVLTVTTVIACVNVVLITALATLAAFLYNITTSLVGGLHVTLSEDA